MPAESAKRPAIRTLTRTRGTDRELAELAKRQHGVVSRQQLLRMGLERGAIGRRIRAGRLHPLHSGVYALGHRLIQQEGRWMAAVLASGPAAVLSHWSAATLWGLKASSRTRIDVTVAHRSRSSDLIRRHLSEVPPDEVATREGIPVTSVPRTILDLAATESLAEVKRLLREMEFRELRDRLSLWDLVERYPGRRGVRKVTTALEGVKDEPVGVRKNPLEERFVPFCRRHRLPLPRFNDPIEAGGERFEVDCRWPGTNEIVELDGWQSHGTKSAFRSDRARDRKLRVAGYSITHLTWNQLDDEPEEIASDLRVLLGMQRKKQEEPPHSEIRPESR